MFGNGSQTICLRIVFDVIREVFMNREKWLKGLKYTLAAVLAIIAADFWGLKYSATAGIITILSIQSTKKETLKVAGRRGTAFLCALLISAVCYKIFGFTIAAFAVYLFFFSCICLYFSWVEAIAMDSVLITHFLIEQNMGMELLCNEILIFVLGAGMGIMANLHLRKKGELFDRLAQQADRKMRDCLLLMKKQLEESADGGKTNQCLQQLNQELTALKECAYKNWNNSLFRTSVYETEYAEMRSRQAEVLQRIAASLDMLENLPDQAQMVAGLLAQIEQEYDRDNTVEKLLERLTIFYENMKEQPLPESREEFEARAVLFYVLKQVEEFLKIKRKFVLSMP